MTKKRKFEYTPRSAEDIEKRTSQGGNNFDSPLKVKPFTPSEEGEYLIRILPPTWDEARHFGYDVFIHYQVGPDNGSYICPQSMHAGDCPICEERSKADREGESDYASELKPTKRVAAYIIDRDNEEAGPQIWLMPVTADREFTKHMKDKFSGDLLMIDHPEDGYDVSFTREGQGINTRYSGFQVARQSSPITKDEDKFDEWLDYVTENPLPDQLNIYDYDHISKVFSGHSGGPEETSASSTSSSKKEEEAKADEPPFEPDDKKEEEEEEDERPRRRRRRTEGASDKMKSEADD